MTNELLSVTEYTTRQRNSRAQLELDFRIGPESQ